MCSQRKPRWPNFSNGHRTDIVCTKCSKGFRLERRKPFIIYNELVARVRNLPIAPTIRFEIPIVEVAQNFACALQGLP
jgi:hypothetical protein